MIIQSAPAGAPPSRLVISQLAHTALAARFAAAFGNGRFAALTPRGLMEFVVAHHDEGWAEVDARMPRDPRTGLPCSLVETPMALLLETGPASAAFNEAHHPFCGLLVSMHVWGLYNGRYGLSDRVLVERVPAEHKPAVTAMLDGELARQARLRAALAAVPGGQELASEQLLRHDYKLLQFFDTLALYFNCTAEADRGTAHFAAVPALCPAPTPARPDQDETITVRRLAPGRYAVDPFPFARTPLVVECEGRRLAPCAPETDMAAALAAAPIEYEIITLVEGQ